MAKQLREYSRQSQRKSAELNSSQFATEDDMEDEFKDILSSIVNEDYIISVTGIKDLSKVEYISLQLDTKEQALYDLSDILPNLQHLVLDNSQIGSIRDLGTGLRLITSLSLSGCNLRDLDGIGVLVGLQELCLSDNLLADISPLTLHENLENLNLSNNRISDLTFGVVLSSCPKLRSLFLTKNPIEKLTKYRAVVSFLLSGLEMLDGTPIDTISSPKYSPSLMDDAHIELNLIREDIEEELRLDDTIFEDLHGRKDCSRKVSGSSPMLTTSDTLPDTGSDLTHGSAVVLAGNVAAAMRKRRVGGDSLTESSMLAEDSETTLDVLDSALRAKTPTTRTNSDKVSFVAEGDITEIVLGSPQKMPQYGMSPARPLVKSHGKAFPQNVSMSFDNDPSAIRRPKTAFSGSALRDSDKSYDHLVNKANTPERQQKDDTRAASPKQRNSSRPQSAAVSPAEVTSLFHERNLPFVVSRDEFRNFANGDSDEDEIHQSRDIMIKKEVKETPQNKLIAKGSTGSLAHQNMVRRFKSNEQGKNSAESNTPSKLKMPLPSIGDDFQISEDSDEEEDIAITHSERLRFMISKKDDTLAKMNKSRLATLKKLQGQVLDECENINMDFSSTQTHLIDKNATRKVSTVSGTDNASSVEKKLGINLAGSLAAIDRWVQDVDSGEDESEAEQPRAVHTGQKPVILSASTVIGASVRPPTGKDKILSRDAIFNLCWNTSEKRPDSRSSSRPSSGLRKESSIGSMADSSIASDTDAVPKVKTSEKNKAVERRRIVADYAEDTTTSIPKSVPPYSLSTTKPSVSQSKTPLPKQQELSALQLSDQELIELLRKPPKTVVALRTKASFQEFFRGIDMERFTRLLHAAYADISDIKDRESKIARRLSLMECS